MKRLIRLVAVAAIVALGCSSDDDEVTPVGPVPTPTPGGAEIVLASQGEWLDAYIVENGEVVDQRIFIAPDDPAFGGRHINGTVCFFPPGHGHDGQFVAADDTYREACVDIDEPQARCAITDPEDPAFVGNDPDGWGILNADGSWAKRVLATTTPDAPDARGTSDPQGCAFDEAGNLYGNDVGGADPTAGNGNLIVFFADDDYSSHCFLATGLSQPSFPVFIDGELWVAQTGGAQITKLGAPFPQTADDCELVPDGSSGRMIPVPKAGKRPTQTALLTPPDLTPAALIPLATGAVKRLLVSSPLLTPSIVELLDVGLPTALPARVIVPPLVPQNPLGMALTSDRRTLFFVELALDITSFATGCGRLSKVTADSPLPAIPSVVRGNLRFPDGVTIVDPGRLDVDFASRPPLPDQPSSECTPE